MANGRASRPVALAALAALALPGLVACQSQQEVTGSLSSSDYRDRHPITLANDARVLDLFVEGPTGMPVRSRQDLAGFLAEYQRYGNSGLVVQVPVGTENRAGTQAALSEIRAVAGGRVSVDRYQPAMPSVASPIRVSFRRLQAKVSAKCGMWPEDLGVGSFDWSAANQQWHNFGCAYQSNLASQVADPVDLVRGRQQTAPDTNRRMYNIGQNRQGQDPTTTWKVESGSVAQSLTN